MPLEYVKTLPAARRDYPVNPHAVLMADYNRTPKKQYHVYKDKGYTREPIFKGHKSDWKKFLKSKYVKDLQHANYKIITRTVNY